MHSECTSDAARLGRALRAQSSALEASFSEATLEELAADVSISARQLQRLFIEGTGLKFAQWRNRARLNQVIAKFLRTEDNLGTAMGASTFSTKQGLLRALSRECGTPIDQLTAEHAAA